ncbi:MAG: amidase [Pseudoclavibacter sp.]
MAIPQDQTDLAYLSAAECLRRYRSGDLSPVDVLQAQQARHAEIGERVNAFTETMDDWALQRARESEARYRDGDPLPLDGITVGIKEKHAIKGYRITQGSTAWDGEVPDRSTPYVERLLDAGVVPVGRTTTPEFCIAPFTHTDMWGVTPSAWNADFAAGGSSGGSGAALAAGLVTLATGSDIGGSTRIPSAFNGVYGFKGPYGRIPGNGAMALEYFRGDSAMGRGVEDVRLMQNVMSGPSPRDHASLRPKLVIPEEQPGVEGLRIALDFTLGDFLVDDEIIANTRALADGLAARGAEIVEVHVPWTREMLMRAVSMHFALMEIPWIQESSAAHPERLLDYTRAILEQMGPLVGKTTLYDSARAEAPVQEALAQAMVGFDALLCPTTAAVGLPAGDSLVGGVEINGTKVPSLEAVMSTPFNVCNRCPIMAAPTGHAANGMPTGVQIVGQTYDDLTVFRIAAVAQEVTGWDYSRGHRPEL